MICHTHLQSAEEKVLFKQLRKEERRDVKLRQRKEKEGHSLLDDPIAALVAKGYDPHALRAERCGTCSLLWLPVTMVTPQGSRSVGRIKATIVLQ